VITAIPSMLVIEDPEMKTTRLLTSLFTPGSLTPEDAETAWVDSGSQQ